MSSFGGFAWIQGYSLPSREVPHSASRDASSPLAYLGFVSLLAITASHGVTAGRSWRRLQDRHLANIAKGI
jgi:hypothetical protein